MKIVINKIVLNKNSSKIQHTITRSNLPMPIYSHQLQMLFHMANITKILNKSQIYRQAHNLISHRHYSQLLDKIQAWNNLSKATTTLLINILAIRIPINNTVIHKSSRSFLKISQLNHNKISISQDWIIKSKWLSKRTKILVMNKMSTIIIKAGLVNIKKSHLWEDSLREDSTINDVNISKLYLLL